MNMAPLRQSVSMLFIVAIMSFAAITHAEIYTGEGSYIMSEGENLGVAKERAKADAIRNASEKAGVYVKNYTRTKNLMLEEDIIETMTANILKLVEAPIFLPYEQLDNLEGLLIRVFVKVQIDDSDINRWLNKNEQEKSALVSQNEYLRKANAEQELQIAELKRQLSNAKTKADKETITKKFVENYAQSGQCELPIQNYNKVIEINPNDAVTWGALGTACSALGQDERAIIIRAVRPRPLGLGI